MNAWVPFDIEGWAAVAEVLPLPWPDAAASFDLRVYAASGVLPGRERLRRRWGWTDHKVRMLLRDEYKWVDPKNRQPVASRSPAGRQPVASRDTDTALQSGDNRQPVASQSPAGRQVIAIRARSMNKDKDSRTLPQPLPAERAGATARAMRVEWVTQRGLLDLCDLRQRGKDVAAALQRYELGEAALVDAWWQYCRGHNGHRIYQDAPSGLRRREIVDGLMRAAQQWRDVPPTET